MGSGLVHIRIQQRNGRKTLTTVQGLESQFDKKKLVRAFKKEFACNGEYLSLIFVKFNADSYYNFILLL